MPTVVICSDKALEAQLGRTLLWRQDVERFTAASTGAAVQIARNVGPDLILVDCDLPDALDLVRTMAGHPLTRDLPVAVLVHRVFDVRGLEFIDAGAKEILRLPAGPEWDERLTRLFRIRGRRAIRLPLRIQIDVFDRGSPLAATGIDLSASGLLLSCRSPLKVGEQVRLTFRVPGFADPVRSMALVVRDAGETRYGLQFLYLEDDGLDRVRHVIENG